MTGPVNSTQTPATMSLKVENLSHSFTDSPLFSGLSFEVFPGEVVALVGPSGSGKSTLLSILSGWLKPTHGTVQKIGIETTGWVFQNPLGTARRTVLDHVVLPLLGKGYSRAKAQQLALDILAKFSLENLADHQYRLLSGGESTRLMLARAAATAPSLLLIDEPTAQLDLATSASVNAVIASIAQENTIVLVATHDPQTKSACSRVIDLADYQKPVSKLEGTA